ncbi:MAG: hypoxanthine phosphoribosyltransferase [Oligoflexales bacterium]|nr:hypoxanthine phosphoribosyltransferase [Oligoflexales bacterium]
MDVTHSTLISAEKIANRISEMGKEITKVYEGEPVTVICVLKGAFIFAADLIRSLDLPVKVEFIGVSSYQGTKSTGHVRITNDLSYDVAGKNVLLVEDIIDSGKTIDYLTKLIGVRGPKSLKICTFLSKPDCHDMTDRINFIGFEIEDRFVVGYGLDLDGRYRELPYLAELKSL